MRRMSVLTSGVLLAVLLVSAGVAGAGAPSYELASSALNSGGGPAAGGSFGLDGSLGQTAPGVGEATGISMSSGFWYTTSRGGKLYLPVVLKNVTLMPNLVIDELEASATTVTVVIRNAGTARIVNDFWVDVSFDPTTRPPHINQPWNAIATHGVVWGVRADEADLDPGDSLTLVNNASDPFYFAAYSSHPPLPVSAAVYAYVDSVDWATTWGAVRESNEDDNTAGPVTSVAADAGGESFPQPAGEVATGNLPPR